MSSLRSMLEERARIAGQLTAINNAPAGQDGALSPEQTTQWDALKAQLAGLEGKITRQAEVDELERRMSGTPIAGTGDRHLDQQIQNYSLLRAIASQIPNSGVDAGLEREVGQEVAKRSGRQFKGLAVPMGALGLERRVTTSSGTGGDLIATDLLSGQFIDALRSKMIVRRLGARVLGGLVGDIEIPKLSTSSTTGWVGENAALSVSDPVYAQVPLAPKHAGGIVELSRNMIMQSSPDVEQLVRMDFAALLARQVDYAALQGGGSHEPVGIMSNTSVDHSVSMATPSWSAVQAMIAVVQQANGDENSLAFAMPPVAAKKLKSTLVAASTDSRMIMSDPNMLAGYPAAVSSIVPYDGNSPTDRCSIICGDFSQILIGFWSELDVLVNPYESTAYSKGNVQVRAMMTLDVNLRHTESFTYTQDFLFT